MKALTAPFLLIAMASFASFAHAEDAGDDQSPAPAPAPMVTVLPSIAQTQKDFLRLQLRAASAQVKIAQIGEKMVSDVVNSREGHQCIAKADEAACDTAVVAIAKVVEIMQTNDATAQNNVVKLEDAYSHALKLRNTAEIEAFNSLVDHVNWRKNKADTARNSAAFDALRFSLLGSLMAQKPSASNGENAREQFRMTAAVLLTHTQQSEQDANAEVAWYQGLIDGIDKMTAEKK